MIRGMARRPVTKTRARSAPAPAPESPQFQQERARRTYTALVQAAQELFGAQGYDAIGTPDIADAARQRLAVLLAFVVPRTVCPDPAATAFVIHAAARECAFSVAGLRGTPPMAAEPVKTALGDFIERALFFPA